MLPVKFSVIGINVFLRHVTQYFRMLGFVFILTLLHQKWSECGVRVSTNKVVRFTSSLHPVEFKISQKCNLISNVLDIDSWTIISAP